MVKHNNCFIQNQSTRPTLTLNYRLAELLWPTQPHAITTPPIEFKKSPIHVQDEIMAK